MKNRFFKLFLAALFIVNLFALPACGSNNGDSVKDIEEEYKKPVIPEGVSLEEVQKGTEEQLFNDFYNRLNSSQNATLSVYSRIYYYDTYLTGYTVDSGEEVNLRIKNTKEDEYYGSYGFVADNSADSPEGSITYHYKYEVNTTNNKNIADKTYYEKTEYDNLVALLNGNVYYVRSSDYKINEKETVRLSDLRGVQNASRYNLGNYSSLAAVTYGDTLLGGFYEYLRIAVSYAENKNIKFLITDEDEYNGFDIFNSQINYFNLSVQSLDNKLYINIGYQIRDTFNGNRTKTVDKILYIDLNAGITKEELPQGEVKPSEIKEKCTENVLYIDCDVNNVVQELKAGKSVTLTVLGGGDPQYALCRLSVGKSENHYDKEYKVTDGEINIDSSEFFAFLADFDVFVIIFEYQNFICVSNFGISNI